MCVLGCCRLPLSLFALFVSTLSLFSPLLSVIVLAGFDAAMVVVTVMILAIGDRGNRGDRGCVADDVLATVVFSAFVSVAFVAISSS